MGPAGGGRSRQQKRTHSMNHIQTPTDAFTNGNQLPTEVTLSRTLGLFTITMIGVGGSGG